MAVNGKPAKLDEPHPEEPDLTVRDGLLLDLRDGIPKAVACRRAGIGARLLDNWMDKGATQAQRVISFDQEHPGALDCEHRWSRGTCSGCGTSRAVWDDLVAGDAKDGVYVTLLRDVDRAQAQVVATVIRRLLACGAPTEVEVPEGEDPEAYKRRRVKVNGDWRADAWYLERIDPLQFNLTRRTEEADVDDEPEALPQQFMDELEEMADRMERAYGEDA